MLNLQKATKAVDALQVSSVSKVSLKLTICGASYWFSQKKLRLKLQHEDRYEDLIPPGYNYEDLMKRQISLYLEE